MKNPRSIPVFITLCLCAVLCGVFAAAASAQSIALIARGPYLQSATTNSIIVRWRTDLATESRVRFGTNAVELAGEASNAGFTTEHTVTLGGLLPDTKYFYAIVDGANVLVGGPSYYFTTNPDRAKPTRIWALGDVGTASVGVSAPLWVRDAYANFTGLRPTDVWLMLGDNAYYTGTDHEYQLAVFNVFQEMLRTTPLWPTLGNHETYSATTAGRMAYDDIFDPPQDGRSGGVPSGSERYYSFDYGNIHFLSLDSEITSKQAGSPMLTWLEQDLAATESDWIIAYWHSPPYSKGSHDSDAEGKLIVMRERVVPLLEAYGVDLVLCGHSHSYERSYLINGHYGFSETLTPAMVLDAGSGRVEESGAYVKALAGPEAQRGSVYVVAGSSGQTGFGSFDHPAIFFSLNRLGSMVIDIEGNRLEAKFLRENGLVEDHFTILKGDVAPVIVTAPQSRTTVEGATVSFNVAATGTRPLHYQWLSNGAALTEATNATLTLGNVQMAQAGQYSVVVSNRVGAVTSGAAQLTVNAAPTCVVAPEGLVARWPFDGDANDLVGSSHGALFGDATFVEGQVDDALRLTGGGAWVEIADNASLDLGNAFSLELWFRKDQPYTPGVQSVLFDKRDLSGRCNYGASLSVDFGVITYYSDPGAGGFQILYYPPLPSAGDFHHLAVTYRQASASVVEMKLYLDGQAVKTGSFPGSLANGVTDTPLFLGSGRGVSDFFEGVLDDVSIYQRVLSESEVQDIYAAGVAGKCRTPVAPQITVPPLSQTVPETRTVQFSVSATGSRPLNYQWLYEGEVLPGATNSSLSFQNVQLTQGGSYSVMVSNPVGVVTSAVATLTVEPLPPCVLAPAGIVAWWPFEQGAEDTVGGNAGVLRGGATMAPGRVGQAVLLNGTSSYVEIPDAVALDMTNELTVEMWFRKDQAFIPNVQSVLFDKRDTGGRLNYGASLSVNFGLMLYYMDPSSGGFHSTALTTLPSIGEFHHFAGTYRQASASTVELNIFLDGQLVKTATLPGRLANSVTATPLHVGSARGVSDFFGGAIDETSLYNRALSASEVAAIHAAGANGKCPARFEPSITGEPLSLTVTEEETATFTVAASGTAPLEYQWLYNGLSLEGATNSTLTLNNVQMAQAGRYSVIVSNFIGAVTSAEAVLSVVFPPATLRLADAQGSGGSSVAVPVLLRANGNENALGFSIQFDPLLLAFDRVELGSDAPANTALVANPTDASSGRVGVAIALPADVTFPNGTQSIARVFFQLAPAFNAVSTPLGFGDAPTVRQVSDREAGVLTANYVAGSVVILATDLEGDVAPRPDGDRAVTIIDWVQMGRFVAGLNTITSSNEFQKADCAPRSARGNGVLGITDWVQAGRYAAGLDPVTPVGGPIEEAPPEGAAQAASVAAASLNRIVSLTDATALPGTTSNIPVKLVAQGNENALGFSVAFDAGKLQFVSAALGASAANALLNLNQSQIAQGRLGLALGLPAGSSFAAGERELVVLRFAPIEPAAGSTPISFADTPVRREVSDVLAEPLTAAFSGAVVTLQPAGPALGLSLSGENLVIFWPQQESGGFELESTAQLNGGAWNKVNIPPIIIGGQKIVTVPLNEADSWYRLRKP